MKKFWPILLVFLLLSGCVKLEPVEPSPSVSPTTTVSIYVPDNSGEQTKLNIEYASLAELTPQALLDEVAKRHSPLYGLKVKEFAVDENIRTRKLTISEDFKNIYASAGDLVARNKLVASICYTFMDAYELDYLLFTCEGAPFTTGSDTFSGVQAGFEYIGEVIMDKSAYLCSLDGNILIYDEMEILYSWETDRIKEYEDYLKSKGEDFSDWYWAVVNMKEETAQGEVTESTIIRLCKGTNEYEYSTSEELKEYLKNSDEPVMFKIKYNRNGEITHLLQYGLGIGTD